MGMMDRPMGKAHTWYWRARFWWYDTESGAYAKAGILVVAAIAGVLDIVKLSVTAYRVHTEQQPQQAVIWWVVYLIVALVAAALAYALMPKVEQQKPAEPKGPTTEDGQPGILYWGTHRAKDTFLLAWKITGRDPIKGKGGK